MSGLRVVISYGPSAGQVLPVCAHRRLFPPFPDRISCYRDSLCQRYPGVAHFASPTKCSRILAAVTDEAVLPPVCLMSAISLLICSLYSSSRGIGQYFSPAIRPAAIISPVKDSSLQNRPVIVEPRATTMPPVRVARSMMGIVLRVLHMIARRRGSADPRHRY